MKQVLEPIVRIPGVRIAALVTPDGVPITVHGERRPSKKPQRDDSSRDDDSSPVDVADDIQALAALATGWMGDVNRAVAPLSWSAPSRLVLRAARGTLIVMQAPGALLLVVLDSGMRAEELRLPMEGAVARMQRHLRQIAARTSIHAELDHQPSVLPHPRTHSNEGIPDGDANKVSTTRNEVPEVSGE